MVIDFLYTNLESLLFSDKIIKINRYNMSQDRQLVLTDKAVYNFKKKIMKRRIDYSTILGISISKLTDEFVIHGSDNEYDYDFVSSKRKIIIEIIANSYKEETGKELILCLLDHKSLKPVVTLKPEKRKDPNFTRMTKEGVVSLQSFLYGAKEELALGPREGGYVPRGTIYSRRKDVKEVSYDDFNIISVIGRGSFGKVCLVEFKNTGDLYAMKSIKKDVLLDQEQIENTLLEKQILQSLEHPFLVSLVFCFQTADRIYFIMNFLRGGELFQHLRKFRIFDEEKVRFYGSQIAMALEHLHKFGIIYRDLKPENILMDDEGYLQLADFGMAKHLKSGEKAMSFCGTPEYLAPEVVVSEGHDKMADWWSFGILL